MFRLIRLVITYLPLIIMVVKTVEGMTSKDTSGDDKRTLAIALILDALRTFGVTVTPEIEEFIGRAIDVVVRALNLLGIFEHDDGVPTPEEEGVAPANQAAVVAETVRAAVREVGPNDLRLDELERQLYRE